MTNTIPNVPRELLQTARNALVHCRVSFQAGTEIEALDSLLSAPSPAGVDGLPDSARDVLAERQRQISAEDFDAGHDDMATGGQLADAAACYALWAGGINPANWSQFWPWDREWLKRAEPRRMLVKAGALILAEIERIDRAAATAPGGE